MRRSSYIALVVAGLISGTAAAHPEGESPSDEILPPPPTYKANGVTVDEHVGATIPLDTAFRTSDGKAVTLRELVRGELPTILTFNYSDCPMLCSLQLNGLSAVLPKIAEPVVMAGQGAIDGDKPVAFRIGAQVQIITIDLEPSEPLDKLQKMKERYITKLPEAQQAGARKGWTFLAAALPGDGAAIRRVAESVGFKYVYVQERAEWAHPAALIFLSTTGVVTRYVYGIEFDPAVVRESVVKAGVAEPATAVGFLNRCYHFDPDASSHTRAGVLALRLGAAGFLVLLASGLGFVHVRRRRRVSGES
jgi:protein SCO1/2